MKTKTIIAILLTIAACDPIGWPPPIDPPTDTGKPPEFVPCDGVLGGISEDDPCCPVHQCLLESPALACVHLDLCRDMIPDGVVCGDQMCEDGECSTCEGWP
jgi:hypothetical protein